MYRPMEKEIDFYSNYNFGVTEHEFILIKYVLIIICKPWYILITINLCSIAPSCNPHQDLVQKLRKKLAPKCLQIQSGKKHTKQDFATHKKPINDSEISRLNWCLVPLIIPCCHREYHCLLTNHQTFPQLQHMYNSQESYP